MKTRHREILIIAVIIAALNIPFFVLVIGSGDYTVGDYIFASQDYSTYLSKMKIGYDGEWLYHNRYSTEIHEPVFIFIFYILLGHLSRICSFNLQLTYHLARILLSFLALLYLMKFIKKYSNEKHWMPVFLFSLITPALTESGVIFPQVNLYVAILGYPHYMVTLLSFLLFVDSILRYVERKSLLQILQAITALNALAMIHPFLIVIAGLVPAVTLIVNKKLMKGLRILAISALCVLPLMAYYLYVFGNNPMLVGWRSQTIIPIPWWQHLAIFSIGSVYCYISIFLIVKREINLQGYSVLFLVWFFLALGLSFTRIISSNLDWLFFASIPVSFLSCQLISYAEKNFDFKIRLKGRSVIIWLLIAMFITRSIFQFGALTYKTFQIILAKEELNDFLIAPEDKACLDWLNKNTNKIDVIAAAPNIGNLIPVYTSGLVYCGHISETLNYIKKKEEMNKLITGKMDFDQAKKFIADNHITYLVFGKTQDVYYNFLVSAAVGKTIDIYKFAP